MKQKVRIIRIFALLVLLITFSACKKDVFKVKTEMHYKEQVVAPEGGSGGGMALTLKPNNSAILIEGGDQVALGGYKIQGKILIVKVDNVKEYIFTIVSEQEIHARTGEKLILVQP
jgi:hypothetical protein